MAQIIEQPNGEYALWSEASQEFVLTNADRWDIARYMMYDEEIRIYAMIDEVLNQLKKKKKPYGRQTLGWRDAKKKFKKAHGKPYKLDEF